uniref:Uncharacterized protein n=1 Tax=Brassica juncea TaxID=3707 RepID=Q9G467_BRAJU|nr:unknown [Brassica juncea]
MLLQHKLAELVSHLVRTSTT